MTTPPGHPDPIRWDIGNRLLQPSPIEMTLTLATDPATGQASIIATFRTSTGTLTGTVDRESAENWIAALTRKLDKMPRIILARGPAAPPNLAPPNGHHP